MLSAGTLKLSIAATAWLQRFFKDTHPGVTNFAVNGLSMCGKTVLLSLAVVACQLLVNTVWGQQGEDMIGTE